MTNGDLVLWETVAWVCSVNCTLVVFVFKTNMLFYWIIFLLYGKVYGEVADKSPYYIDVGTKVWIMLLEEATSAEEVCKIKRNPCYNQILIQNRPKLDPNY